MKHREYRHTGSVVDWRVLSLGFIVAFVAGSVPTASQAEDFPLRFRSISRTPRARSDRWKRLWGDDRLVDPISDKGQAARGLYFNGPVAGRLGSRGIIRSVRGARLNTAVINLKDGQGRVLYDTKIEVLQKQKRRLLRNAPKLIGKIRRAGIYTVGRVVCFSDPILPRNHPERAVLDGRPRKKGGLWAATGRRNTWLDPYNRANHDLIVELAREAEALGVDEVQFDYFRFPVDETTRYAVFPAQVDTPRRRVLLGLLKRIDEAIKIPIGVDVFGLTAFRKGDRAGLGQSLEEWAMHAEVFTPMLYINGMGLWMRRGEERRAMRLVEAGIARLRRRLGHGPVIRPFLQAFSQGADYYNPEFIAEQIRGARNGGADGFLFWHPASDYRMVRAGMSGPARGIVPFPLDDRMRWRRQAWGDSMSPTARAAYFRQLDPRGSFPSPSI